MQTSAVFLFFCEITALVQKKPYRVAHARESIFADLLLFAGGFYDPSDAMLVCVLCVYSRLFALPRKKGPYARLAKVGRENNQTAFLQTKVWRFFGKGLWRAKKAPSLPPPPAAAPHAKNQKIKMERRKMS